MWSHENLTSLDFSQNTITILPEEISILTNLKQIRLSNNKLEYLPVNLLKMPNLQSIEFTHNNLNTFYDINPKTGRVFSKEDIQLPNLTYISLNTNNLTEIPYILKFMPKLQ